MMHAHVLEKLPLLGAAGGGEDRETEVLCDLDRGLPHPAGAGMDEDALSRLHAGEFVDGVVRSQEDRGQGRRFDKGHRVGFPENHVPMDRDVAAEAVGGHPDDIVPGLEVFDGRTDADDGA